MRRFVVRSVAEAEVAEAVGWYAQRSLTFTRIRRNPESFPIVQGRLRCVLVGRCPYAVYYRLFPTAISVVEALRPQLKRDC